MRKPTSRRSVAPLALTLAAVATAVAQEPPAGGPRSSPEVNPSGRAMAGGTTPSSNPSGTGIDAVPLTPSTPAVKGVQAALGHAVEAVVGPHAQSDLMKMIAPADRQRIGAAATDWSDVDRAAEAFRSAWQAQFGQSYKVDDKVDVVFTEPTTHVEQPTTAPAGGTTRPATTAVRLIGPGGRTATVLRLAQDGGGPDPAWRIVLPPSATAATLHDSLLQHLTAVTAAHARWPTELGQAYVYTTERLLSSLGDPVPVPR